MISFSQFRQDVDVINFFNNRKDLYFVDIGGYYNNWFTNTGLLELNYNWNGISSQLFPRVFEKIKKYKKTECYNYYLFSKTGLSLKFYKYNLLSDRGQTKCLEKKHSNHQIIVKTITLQDFLDKYNAPKLIHYCSLDNEGSEFGTLKSIDFNKYTFLYISIANNKTEPNKTLVKNLLLDNGYLLYNEKDHHYIHETTIIGTYYCKDKKEPIVVKRQNKNDFIVSSPYWDDDIGTFNNGFIEWKTLGRGRIFFTHIDYGDGNTWQRE